MTLLDDLRQLERDMSGDGHVTVDIHWHCLRDILTRNFGPDWIKPSDPHANAVALLKRDDDRCQGWRRWVLGSMDIELHYGRIPGPRCWELVDSDWCLSITRGTARRLLKAFSDD